MGLPDRFSQGQVTTVTDTGFLFQAPPGRHFDVGTFVNNSLDGLILVSLHIDKLTGSPPNAVGVNSDTGLILESIYPGLEGIRQGSYIELLKATTFFMITSPGQQAEVRWFVWEQKKLR